MYAERAADQTEHLADAFVRENFAHGYDVVTTFESLQSTPFRERNSIKEKGYFNVLKHFQCEFGLKKVKDVRITITHIHMFHCINTCRVHGEMFEQSAYRLRVQTPSSGPSNC